jgi:hypothetical protein
MKSPQRLGSAVIKNHQSVHLPIHLPESAAQPDPSSSSTGMRELIEKALQAKLRPAAEFAMEIERRRTDARRKLDEVVATVEFNDPFIDPADVYLSREQLWEAREAAAAVQARITGMTRRHQVEALPSEENPGIG